LATRGIREEKRGSAWAYGKKEAEKKIDTCAAGTKIGECRYLGVTYEELAWLEAGENRIQSHRRHRRGVYETNLRGPKWDSGNPDGLRWCEEKSGSLEKEVIKGEKVEVGEKRGRVLGDRVFGLAQKGG